MLILLNRKRLEAALPDVAAGTVMAVVAADMARQQPLHPAAEISIVVRPKHQVKMVVEQAIREHAHRQARVRRRHQSNERRKIAILMEYVASRVAAVQNVVTEAAYRGSCGSWHARQHNHA